MKLKNIAAITVTLMLAGAAHAAKPGLYAGGGLGYSYLNNFSDAKANDGGGLGSVLFTGYNFNKYLGVEAGYRTYGRVEYVDNENSDLTSTYKIHNFSFVGKAYVPVDDASPFDLYVMLGAAQVYSSVDIKDEYFGTSLSSSRNILVPTAGIGASYNLTSHIAVGLESTYTGGKSGDNDNAGIPQTFLTAFKISYGF